MIFDWISFKKIIKFFFFLYGILFALLKILEIEKDMIHEKFKKIEKCSKKVTIFSSNLKRIFGLENIEIWFSLFLKKLYIIEFPFKNTNLESIGILSRKLKPKYEAGAASSSNSFQNSNGYQRQIRSSSFKQVISSLSFRRKLIT